MESVISDWMVENKTIWIFKGEVDYVDYWFLMGTPIPMLLTLLGYWAFVLKLGPDYMKDKPALNISKILAVYNIAQVGVSCYVFYVGNKLILPNGLFHSSCPMKNETSKLAITSGIYVYFLSKISELLDTVFFVLKKNYRQVTFLHLYHHSIMLLNTWVVLKYEPSYDTIFLGTVNSLVHIVMYTYYYLSTFPQLSKYLWWKKYITEVQIVQFVLIIIQATASYWFSGCPPSFTLLAIIILNAFIIMVLFIKFYIRSYSKAEEKKLLKE